MDVGKNAPSPRHGGRSLPLAPGGEPLSKQRIRSERDARAPRKRHHLHRPDSCSCRLHPRLTLSCHRGSGTARRHALARLSRQSRRLPTREGQTDLQGRRNPQGGRRQLPELQTLGGGHRRPDQRQPPHRRPQDIGLRPRRWGRPRRGGPRLRIRDTRFRKHPCRSLHPLYRRDVRLSRKELLLQTGRRGRLPLGFRRRKDRR